MEEKPTALESEIQKINAYTKLAKKYISIAGVHAEMEKEVNGEFHAWVQTRIQELMGKKAPRQESSLFSQEEVEILKGFAAQIKVRNQKPAPTPAPTTGQVIGQPRSAPAPLKEAIDTKAYNDQQRRILAEVQRLADMDRNGPEY
jgi:hypothetical protein